MIKLYTTKGLKMKRFIALGFSALISCGVYAQTNQTEDDQAIATAKQVITDNLKDPDSAKFKNITVYRITNQATGKTEISAICGEVNAKNSYGGYVGFKKFATVMLADKPKVAVEDGQLGLYPMLKAFCQ